jgi:hypothetical protein
MHKYIHNGTLMHKRTRISIKLFSKTSAFILLYFSVRDASASGGCLALLNSRNFPAMDLVNPMSCM